MKYFFAICLSVLMFHQNGQAQAKSSTHKVEKGETINQIAQKYQVTPFDIYQLNPDAQSGLKPNSVLIIPTKASKKAVVPAAKAKVTSHEVQPKETLYGIEKKYGITDEALKAANPFLESEGLQIGQVLTIPGAGEMKSVSKQKVESAIFHTVLAKETKYSISKKYGLTVEELEKKNPEIVANLPVGYELIIKGNTRKVTNSASISEAKKESIQVVSKPVSPKVNFISYNVRPKETLYSLSKMAGISQEELLQQNPALANGVEVGMEIKIPESATTTPLEVVKKDFAVLTKKSSERKKLALLLPFNISKIENDTVNSISSRIKKDKFLNMTLDFYAGAMMAIDSAKVLGLNMDIKILDSQETKNSTAVAALIKSEGLSSFDAVIGPFYQNNVEKAAEILAANQVPVVSPLSKDLGVSYPNLVQSIPDPVAVKNAVFDFMRSKGGNIIAVVDKKKGSVIKYITDNHSDVRFAPLTATGGVTAESIKGMLKKDKINYVIMETANTGMIKSTVASLMSAMTTYKVQLVILEPNETLDTDEINFNNLVKLKLMYPSVTRESYSEQAAIFEKEFKKKNKSNPSVFAIRGFDVTFDTMMRLAQDKSYLETVGSTATEQMDNKFEFYKNNEGAFINKGIYILQYESDLTIKEAK
ncbi:MAG: LysM peptidoglycan-binding domain-containing protein [Flavobacterium sp.]